MLNVVVFKQDYDLNYIYGMLMPFSQGIGDGKPKMEAARVSHLHPGKQGDQAKTQVKAVANVSSASPSL